MDEAIRRIETVNSDYLKHRRAALAVAEEFFSYRVVIPKILEEALK